MKNNFFNNLYFFSKLSTSFILLILLIFFGFLFYKSYEYEDDNDANNLNIMINSLSEKIDNIDKDLDKINIKILTNQKSLNTLNNKSKESNNIELSEKYLNKISNLSLQNDNLNKEIENLKSFISTFESQINKDSSKEPNFILKNSIDLIRMRYESGLDVKQEIFFISEIITDNSKKSYLEKLIILSDKNFQGIESLQSSFQNLMKSYLDDYFMKKNNNLLYSFLSKFYTIGINQNAKFKNQTIETFSIIENKLREKDISSSLLYIKDIENGSIYFKDWITECEKYEEFNNNLKLVYNKI